MDEAVTFASIGSDLLSTESDMLIIRKEMIQSMRHTASFISISPCTRPVIVGWGSSSETSERREKKKNEITTCENHVEENFEREDRCERSLIYCSHRAVASRQKSDVTSIADGLVARLG